MNSTSLILSGLLCWTAASIQAQSGCTDPQAFNFNPGATTNDGSCLYPPTSYAPVLRSTIDNDLREISGLHLADGEWWAHNDSGFDPDFFSLDPENGDVLKKITLKNARNRDWEDVCSDGAHLYFGDFGNNNNDRENLGIYRVPYTAIGNSGNQSINEDEYAFLPFAYPDQSDFSTQPEDSTQFDCEAMVFTQNKLHLFTKNRKDYITTHYRLDPGNASIQNVETFNSEGLITGASITPDGKLIALVGYDLRGLPTVFCWLLWDWPAGTDLFFSGNKRRIELGSALLVGQVESIGFETNSSGYIANEKTEYNGFLIVPTSTWSFDFSEWLPGNVHTKAPASVGQRLTITPNPSGGLFFLETGDWRQEQAELQIITPWGQTVEQERGMPGQLDLQGLPAGCYHLIARWPDGIKENYRLLRI